VTQVFINYRHVSPDQDLAGFLEGYLKSRGLDFDSSDGSRLRIAWLSTGDSIRIDTLRFDLPDAPPIEGDPKELLNE
jgi:hypothetical protein